MDKKETGLAIAVKDLVKNFDLQGRDSVHVLTGLNLEINQGEFVAIMGPSGSGKSTLVNILSTLETITSGEVKINGVLLKDMTIEELLTLRRSHSAVIFQNFALIDYLTALENVKLPMIVRGISHQEAKLKATEFLEAVDLYARKDHLPEELSGGEQQRVAIARALAHEPKIIYADEPTGNLDVVTGMKIIQLFKDISHKRGITVIIVTHDHNAARETDRIYILQEGKVFEEKSKKIKQRSSKKR
ncbi:MAG: ABC transporter ATP-binding protein [Candidatus Heimdallarchaeota archaeon]|nr:ABC transporter ATP-binding protein [Candidatus Heimdallarchaeota archaeon]MCK4876079.1 ABC transporter ATP-binding protein [Candidatus Heimdallarchaeota archaeon]